ncbi:uncharacterized protein V1518DRAFT_411256 [Limtongia smithiae]|uniref:uncharacterized protein n=1 Tax=Limtongia smithiae TaxID=1125753 RepID=UPI0034CDD894
MRPTTPLFHAVTPKNGFVYLLRHRQGPVIINTKNEVTDKLIRSQLPPSRVPKAERVHDWSLLCVACLPDKDAELALKFYLLELKRKRERLYSADPDLAKTWYSDKFPKRHGRTYEAVSDLENALEYLYTRPTVESAPRVPKPKNVTQPFDVRMPERSTTIYWTNEWYKGADELWKGDVEHKRLPVLGMGGDVLKAIFGLEKEAAKDAQLQ